jgi:hypothetical protein
MKLTHEPRRDEKLTLSELRAFVDQATRDNYPDDALISVRTKGAMTVYLREITVSDRDLARSDGKRK